MALGLIQAAAPASQPAPLTDPTASPAALKAATSAFNAVLSETLSTAETGTVRMPATSNAARTTQPAWMLASLFTATLAGSPAPADTPTDGEAAVTGKGEMPADADAATGDAPADVAIAGDIVVPTPWLAEVQPAAVPTGTAHLPAGGKQTATADGEPSAAGRSVVVLHAQTVPADPRPQMPGHAAPQAGIWTSANVTAANAATLAGAGIEVGSDPAAAAASTGLGSAMPGIDAVAGDASQVSGNRQARPVAGAVPAAFSDFAAPTDAAPQQTTVREAATGAQAAVAEVPSITVTGVTGAESSRLQQVESSPAAAFAVPSQSAGAGQDAPMPGQEQSNGQGRPTTEFTRFAAALAQVSPAASEEMGHAPAAVTAASAPASPAAAPPAGAVPAAAAPQTETPGPENVGRLVQAMRVIARPGAWEANVRLNPEHLGDVSIAIRVERNTVSAVVNAEGAGVRQWLEAQEEAVRSGMAEHGLQLERFIVQRDGQRRGAQPQQQESHRQSPRRQGATPERFEVVV